MAHDYRKNHQVYSYIVRLGITTIEWPYLVLDKILIYITQNILYQSNFLDKVL